MTLAPIVSFLFAWNFLASLVTKRIHWRGIRYELVSPNHDPNPESAEPPDDQMRRSILGKSSQTFTPQKCEPSVQMGVEMPARR